MQEPLPLIPDVQMADVVLQWQEAQVAL